MTGHGRRQTRFIAALVATMGLVGGCAGGGSPTGSEPNAIATAAIVTASAAESTPASSVAAGPSIGREGVELTEASRGQTVAVTVGTKITVVLHSTYWSPATTSAAAIVAPVATSTVAPASPGTCLPGIGCGTVTTMFVARSTGDATLTASRTVCGEARQCQDVDKLWLVDLHVTS